VSGDGGARRDKDTLSPAESYRLAAEKRRLGPTMWLDPPPPLEQDTLWRGLTRDGEIRFLVARASVTAREIATRLDCSPAAARIVGEALVALQLLRSTVNPDAQMQLLVQHDGLLGRLVIDAWPDGGMRAHVAEPKVTGSDAELIGEGIATIVRYSRRRGAYQSNIQLAGDGIEGLAMRYLLESEQILGLIQVAVNADKRQELCAMGYLVQVTPEGTRSDLQRMVDNLRGVAPLAQAQSADDPDGRAWATAILKDFRWDQCARQELCFDCRCSRERVLATLATLPRADLEELAASGEAIETICEYCQERYRVDPRQIGGLLEEPS
jgi:molecular chaperone Hsp33